MPSFHTQGTMCFLAFVCSVLLCVGQVPCHLLPLLKLTSSKNSSCFVLNAVILFIFYFIFYLLFLSCTEVEFRDREKAV